MEQNNCIFCQIVNKTIESKIIYEDEYTMAFLNLYPVSNGHSLVIPKKHFENFSVVEEPYLSAVNKAKQHVALLIMNSSLAPMGMNYASNQGEIAGQTINHYHEHVVPKYDVDAGFKMVLNPVNVEPTDLILEKLVPKK